LACGYVLVGRFGYTSFDDEKFADTNNAGNWLSKENLGPWKARDTAGLTEADDLRVLTIYIAAFYFALTTMTSVGYGDILPFNNVERAYSIVLEFIGAIIFAMVIAQITAVVSTMDTNARQIAEHLDAVTSFVDMRKFPGKLGRRIRRHFRHFYSLKSAIDEVKIFGELSQTLRRTVSAFLVSDLMGSDSFFSKMPPMLWPKLLPLLRPMRFEATETLAVQGEYCNEVYIIVTGSMTGKLIVPGEKTPNKPHTRHIITGDSVNVLSAVGVWTKCVETVSADGAVETYAVSTSEFRALFTASSDVEAFEKMQVAEARNFIMDSSFVDSPYGKPVRYACFGTVKFTVVQAAGLFATAKLAAARSRAQQKGLGGDCASWVVSDLVDKATGKPFNTVWRHQTAKSIIKVNWLPSDKLLQDDGADKPCWAETVKWEDITAPFSQQALRVRVFFSDQGHDRLLGKTIINLEALAYEPIKDSHGAVKGWYQLELNDGRVSNSPTPAPTKKNAYVLQPEDLSNRMDVDLRDDKDSCIELKLKAVRAEHELKHKKKDRAWLLAQERVFKGTVGISDVVELQMLHGKAGANIVDLS
jgi:hypothetical protein